MNPGAMFLLFTVLGWGLGWPLNKVILESMSPFWFAALRSGLAALVLVLLMLPRRQLVLPPRSDLPVVFGIALLHMVGFAVFAAMGLAMVQVGRSMVLAYTSPLWVIPGAALFLGERFTARRVIGMLLGLAGLAVLFNPMAFDWGDRKAVLGH
ncbi:MAG: DMT family transporter, partial [Burkholderiales bacterium]